MVRVESTVIFEEAKKLFEEGENYYKHEDYQNALKCFLEVITINPDFMQKNINIYRKCADTYRNLNDLKKAIEYHRKSFELYHNIFSLKFMLLYIKKIEDYRSAVKEYSKIIKMIHEDLLPELSLSYHYECRGECYEKLGMFLEADADFAKAKKLLG